MGPCTEEEEGGEEVHCPGSASASSPCNHPWPDPWTFEHELRFLAHHPWSLFATHCPTYPPTPDHQDIHPHYALAWLYSITYTPHLDCQGPIGSWLSPVIAGQPHG